MNRFPAIRKNPIHAKAAINAGVRVENSLTDTKAIKKTIGTYPRNASQTMFRTLRKPPQGSFDPVIKSL
jgi:hypothetical protein